MPRERLTNEYTSTLNRLQAAQRKAVIKEKAQIKTVTVQDEQLSSEPVSREDSHRRIQLQEQHRININELRERQQVQRATGGETCYIKRTLFNRSSDQSVANRSFPER